MKKIKDFLQYKRAINFYGNYIIERYNKKLFAVYTKTGVYQNLYFLYSDKSGIALKKYDGYLTFSDNVHDKILHFLIKCRKIENTIIY